MIPLHTRTVHPDFVDGCFGCKVAHVQIPPSAGSSTPAGAYVSKVKAWEAANERDSVAYKTLRRDGLQPARIDGCHDAVRAGATRFEIESGQRFDRAFGSSLATTMRRETDRAVADNPQLMTPVTTPAQVAG